LSHTPATPQRIRQEMPSSSAFRRPILRCVGPPHGGACPNNFNVDVTCARAYVMLGNLHLDHEQDLVVTCDMWHVGAGARGAPAPARARGTTASTARFCSTCSSRCTTTRRKGRRCCASVAARAYPLRGPRRLTSDVRGRCAPPPARSSSLRSLCSLAVFVGACMGLGCCRVSGRRFSQLGTAIDTATGEAGSRVAHGSARREARPGASTGARLATQNAEGEARSDV
jgi:hypothetical protein